MKQEKITEDLVNISCHICSTSKTKQICEGRHLGITAYVSICQECGLVFLTPRWSNKRYQEFYSQEYDHYYRPQVLTSHQNEHQYADVDQKIWSRLNFCIPKTTQSILDIGCGTGINLDYLRSKLSSKATIAGIEASTKCVSYFQKVIGGELISDDVESDWHLGHINRFDLVIMRHVLEHFQNPITALKKVAQVCSSQGLIYIAVPDMMHPGASLVNNWFRVVHTYYFSKATLERTAAMAGLKPIFLESDPKNHELWGIFQQGSADTLADSVYEPQLRLIKYRLIKDRLMSIPKSLKRIAKRYFTKQTISE